MQNDKVSAEEFYQHLYDVVSRYLMEKGVSADIADWLANLAVRIEKLERFES